jgi:hypothetical protein
MPLQDLHSQVGRAGHARHQHVVESELVGYQKVQLTIDFLLHLLQVSQGRLPAQAIWLIKRNHEFGS